ncbi:MAG: error-prone DNA polymerase [Methylobacteriaceae bacterium]|jgi:error-prone DNA polymerase|nr:error-prone DNA polymerase [Methylobacteriaceae bacterium]
MDYAELAVTSNYSFLRAGSHPEEYVLRARELGLYGLGLADRNSVAGVVRAHKAAQELGVGLKVGARLVFNDGTPDILAYPRDREAWGRLCRLLSRGKLRAEKGGCELGLADLLEFRAGQNLLILPPHRLDERLLETVAEQLNSGGERVRLAGAWLFRGDDRRRLGRLQALARRSGLRFMAVNDVCYHEPDRQALMDILTCVRGHCTLEQAGRRLGLNTERHVKAPAEMARLFAAFPGAVRETIDFFDECAFSLAMLRYEYPDETRAGYASPQQALTAFTEEGARRRYPQGVPDNVQSLIARELAVIDTLHYAPYFLTVHDIVRFARSRGILCQGRGSAANSAVCFCLGITEVDPARIDVLFERFISAERNEPPDIDVDFEHERREEVIQYVYARYGRHRAGLTAATSCYRARGALREVAKVFGYADDVAEAIIKTMWGGSRKSLNGDRVSAAGLDPEEPRLRLVLRWAAELIGFPRHLSQHVGGMVMTRRDLIETVPVENAAMDHRTVIEWNKDDLDDLGMIKVDLLALGMLSCLRRGLDLLRQHYGETLSLARIPAEEPAVYAMIGRADTVGVFQIESRAQMSMLPRLKPGCFYDLVIEVAIVRPGPIQGDMVHPYLRRRQGLEAVDYGPGDVLKGILGKTFGVPLFQEQAMRIAVVAAGFTAAEADKLRRAMATFRHRGAVAALKEKFLGGMRARGFPESFSGRCFRQIEGFGQYGFPESHAASFALLAYASSWMKCRYPDVFAAALLNSQPMGFYAPAQIIRDAREHGVPVLPVDINASSWDYTLETPPGPARGALHPRHQAMAADIRSRMAIRMGFRQVSGLSESDARRITGCRAAGYDSLRDVWLRTGLHAPALELLAEADAFGSLGLKRREALWAVKALHRSADKDDLPLFAAAAMDNLEPEMALPPMTPGQEVIEDYRRLKASLKAHPLALLRRRLEEKRATPCGQLAQLRNGQTVLAAGLVLIRQRPMTASGVVFMTLEDESGIANIIVWPAVFEAFRALVIGCRLIGVAGKVQNEAGVCHVIAGKLVDYSGLLAEASALPGGRNFH